jgi:DNA-binding transcriptional LysR family regulator
LNISRASARLRISQPAVSRQLRDLEEELHVDLFRREKHGLKLTPAGDTFWRTPETCSAAAPKP